MTQVRAFVRSDVIVLGAGPAGRAAAVALSRAGLNTILVDRAPAAPWRNVYGLFADEARTPLLQVPSARTWADTLVAGDRAKRLGRGYARVNNHALQADLRAAAAQVREVAADVAAVSDSRDAVTVHTSAGALTAPLAVDARGSGHFRPAGAWQIAAGRVLRRTRGHGFDPDTMVWMDHRFVPGVSNDDAPTFLYAMPLDAERVFVEETSLVAAPALAYEEATARLDRRIAALGLADATVESVERCAIPMDVRPPAGPLARVFAFGVAGGLVHPATGYSLLRAFTRAAELGPAVAAALNAAHPAPAEALRTALWTAPRLRADALLRFGAETAASMTGPELRSFFDAFFDLPAAVQRAYLGPDTTPGEAARAMWAVFKRVNAGLRAHLVRAGAARGDVALLRAAVGF